MYPLFETILVNNGKAVHLRWHEERMLRSRKEIWNLDERIVLEEVIKIPDKFRIGIVRCNISYGKEIGEVTFRSYTKKSIKSLRLIRCDHLDYHLKYKDRRLLNELLSKKDDCDEIIIIKENLITDTTISNLVFFDGIRWITPLKPLLSGTYRQRLVEAHLITEAEIHVKDLKKYTGCKLINAMRDITEEELIPVQNIKM